MRIDLFSAFVVWLKKILRSFSREELKRDQPPSLIALQGEPPHFTPPIENNLSEIPLAEILPQLPSGKQIGRVEKSTTQHKEVPPPESYPETHIEEVISQGSPETGRDSRELPNMGDVTGTRVARLERETDEVSSPHPATSHGLKTPRPYKKKPVTDEIQPTEGARSQGTPPGSRERKPINLGDILRRQGRQHVPARASQKEEDGSKESTDDVHPEQVSAAPVLSPIIEIDMDQAKVDLILPAQQLRVDKLEELPRELEYSVELNGKLQKLPVEIVVDTNGNASTEQKRISLEEPLVTLQVAYPCNLQAREYIYCQSSKDLYVFAAIGNSRGRMRYLYDGEGNANPLPKKDVWVLLDETLELQNEPDVIEERWIWERYQPFRVPLSEGDALIVRNKTSGRDMCFALESSFRVEADRRVEDDFKTECPLFVSDNLRICAPYENQSGWIVWIRGKDATAEIVSKDWTGIHPLNCRIPKSLASDFGEFQVDICEQNTRIPNESLFFRLGPPMELDYSKELVIPDSNEGHTSSAVNLKLDGNDDWELACKESGLVSKMLRNSFRIEVPPGQDTLRFSISKMNKPESLLTLQVTIPRLRWKTSGQQCWSDKPQRIERRDVKPADPFNIFVRTNDYNSLYDLLAVLESKTDGQRLQEGKFIRKGAEYVLELNQFRDTIEHHRDELRLRVEARKLQHSELLGFIEPLHWEAQGKAIGEVASRLSQKANARKIPVSRALVNGSRRPLKKGRGFSKKEIVASGIPSMDVRSLRIPFDKRRKSSYPWNINTLENLKGKSNELL